MPFFKKIIGDKPQKITKYLAEIADYPLESETFEYNADDFTNEEKKVFDSLNVDQS